MDFLDDLFETIVSLIDSNAARAGTFAKKHKKTLTIVKAIIKLLLVVWALYKLIKLLTLGQYEIVNTDRMIFKLPLTIIKFIAALVVLFMVFVKDEEECCACPETPPTPAPTTTPTPETFSVYRPV